MVATIFETTTQVFAERRLQTLANLLAALRGGDFSLRARAAERAGAALRARKELA